MPFDDILFPLKISNMHCRTVLLFHSEQIHSKYMLSKTHTCRVAQKCGTIFRTLNFTKY